VQMMETFENLFGGEYWNQLTRTAHLASSYEAKGCWKPAEEKAELDINEPGLEKDEAQLEDDDEEEGGAPLSMDCVWHKQCRSDESD
jgi:hypothetical protein